MHDRIGDRGARASIVDPAADRHPLPAAQHPWLHQPDTVLGVADSDCL
jgi:hypothetical protein